jgi:hypothetical protein
MLADTTAMDVSAITPALSAIGSLGFAIWFAYYTTTKTLPEQQKEHRDAIKELTETHSGTIKELTETHAGTIKEMMAEMRSGRESFERWRTATHQ